MLRPTILPSLSSLYASPACSRVKRREMPFREFLAKADKNFFGGKEEENILKDFYKFLMTDGEVEYTSELLKEPKVSLVPKFIIMGWENFKKAMMSLKFLRAASHGLLPLRTYQAEEFLLKIMEEERCEKCGRDMGRNRPHPTFSPRPEG